jgi:hypothetical protein
MEYENFLDTEGTDFSNANGERKRGGKLFQGLKTAGEMTPAGMLLKGAKNLNEQRQKNKKEKIERETKEKADERAFKLEKIRARQESKKERIAGRKEFRLSGQKGAGLRDLIGAGSRIISEAKAKGVPPEIMGAQIVASPEAQERLTNYVEKMGQQPAGSPEKLAVQATELREQQIQQRMMTPPIMATTPEEVETQMIDEEYQEDYIPEVLENGDEDEFSNYVDPATWCSARMVAFSPFAQDMLRSQTEKNEMENMENEVMDFFGKKDKNQDYTFFYLVIIILAFVIFGKN